MLEDPFSDEDPKPRPVRAAWAIWIIAIPAIIAAVALLASCSTPPADPLPACERWEYSVVTSRDGEQYMVLDMENANKLAAMLHYLAQQKCRLVPLGES